MLYLVRLRLLILVVVCLIVTFATGIAIGVADQTPVPNLESTTLNAVQPVAPASLPIAGSTNALLGINPDVNNDGLTDIVDFMQMAAAFGKTPADADWDPALDLNSDGVIDINDFPLATTRWRRRPVFIVLTSPANSEGNVLLTRETIIEFSGPINPATATSSAVSAQSAGQPLTGQLRFSPAGKTVTLFYGEPLPLSTAVRVTIDSSHLIDADGYAVDADGDGLAGGVATINFNTRGPAPLASNGATLFASNLCRVCHGEDGSGGISGHNIQGRDAPNILIALDREVVHAGITATPEEAADIAAFLAQPGPLPVIDPGMFADPANCRICHPRQYQEWQGTMMSYGAISPVFSALEALGNELTAGALAKGVGVTDGSDLFCERCHNPIDAALDNFPTFERSGGLPMRSFASSVGARGLSCDFCHQVSGPNLTRELIGDLGDGIANNAFILTPGETKFGPIQNPEPNPVHVSANSEYLRSSEFCGSCHDVRPRANDVLVEGEPFQRLENLFTEWEQGPYGPMANQVGGVVTCQDCHMEAGPPAPPGTYPNDITTVFPQPRDAVQRRVSTHYFTGVDIALIPFPGQDDAGLDSHGLSIGQKQRRDDLLRSAATVELSVPPSVASGDVLPIIVDVTNVGAGHNIPSGFSQERQMWIELIVADADGGIIYQSGQLEDNAHPETGELVPDGNLHDEDLQNLIVVVDPETAEATTLLHGPDYNQRHDAPPVNLGLANFGNEFLRVNTETGEEEEVFVPFLANHVDNSHSIPPLETESVRYDVLIPSGHAGPLTITARLRFRAFPPRFLRLLAQVRPDLLSEEIVDRNLIVEMAEAVPVAVSVTQ